MLLLFYYLCFKSLPDDTDAWSREVYFLICRFFEKEKIMDKRENNIVRIAVMDRQELSRKLLTMRCEFPIDFSREFLDSISIEHLRHIVLDASFHEIKRFREAG